MTIKDISKKSHKIVKVCVFLVILSVLVFLCNKVLTPKWVNFTLNWPTTSAENEFYKTQKNTVDVLFLGSSVTVNGFIPQELYNKYGLTSFNLGSEQQSISISYWWLMEALRYQNPKAVVLDCRFVYNAHPNRINTDEAFVRKAIDGMRWSINKIKTVREITTLDPNHSAISYYFENFRYHERWKSLGQLDFKFGAVKRDPLKGFGPLNHRGPGKFDFRYNYDHNAKIEMNATQKEYLDRIVSVCKENNITLVLETMPVHLDTRGVNTLRDYAKANNVIYHHLGDREELDAINAKLPKESIIPHANLFGAIKLTDYIGKVLIDAGVQPSGTTPQPQYEKTRSYFDYLKNEFELTMIDNLSDYLSYLNSLPDISVFIVVRDEAAQQIKSHFDKFKQLGIDSIENLKFRDSMLFYINKESGDKFLQMGQRSLDHRGFLINDYDMRVKFYMLSQGLRSGNNSNIVINGSGVCKNRRGLNFAVYDPHLGKVIDSVNFDTFASPNPKAVRR